MDRTAVLTVNLISRSMTVTCRSEDNRLSGLRADPCHASKLLTTVVLSLARHRRPRYMGSAERRGCNPESVEAWALARTSLSLSCVAFFADTHHVRRPYYPCIVIVHSSACTFASSTEIHLFATRTNWCITAWIYLLPPLPMTDLCIANFPQRHDDYRRHYTVLPSCTCSPLCISPHHGRESPDASAIGLHALPRHCRLFVPPRHWPGDE